MGWVDGASWGQWGWGRAEPGGMGPRPTRIGPGWAEADGDGVGPMGMEPSQADGDEVGADGDGVGSGQVGGTGGTCVRRR